jgi:magnesium-transporting ATPase (P-type)
MAVDSAVTPDSPPWYSLSRGAVSAEVDATADGLTSEDAARRREEYGPNRLPRAKPRAWWQIGLHQFQIPVIYLLAIAAIVSFAIGEVTDSGSIVAVLLLSASIRGTQELHAERSSQALQQLLRSRATVIRDGETHEIDSEDVVPGDVVLLESGYRVPADIRLLSTQGLKIDESVLIGESAPVLKDEAWSVNGTVSLGDRRNMAYAGTVATVEHHKLSWRRRKTIDPTEGEDG